MEVRAAGREDPALLLGGGLVGDTTNDGPPDRNIFQCDRIKVVRVLVEDGEVGELAGLDAADQVVHLDLMGAAERDGMQRVVHWDALVFAQHVARWCDAIDGTPCGMEMAHGGHRRVGMDRERDAFA